jgi:hypothetical protein
MTADRPLLRSDRIADISLIACALAITGVAVHREFFPSEPARSVAADEYIEN